MACMTCAANRGELKAPGGVIYEDALWRIEHILEPIPMAGWLIAKPLRHVTTFADLTPEEAAAFGPLMHRTMGAMQRILDAEKVYLCLFSEAEGFVHIHVHLIPAMRDWTAAQRGPAVFELIGEAKRRGNLMDTSKAAAIADRMRTELAKG
jgi:diadenosine tetraphosphate (Ap4A) HIT family hydrolase